MGRKPWIETNHDFPWALGMDIRKANFGCTLLDHLQMGYYALTQSPERGGFFTLILQPPERIDPAWIVPKEMIFVIDKSGSMRGFPIDTAKETMRMCIENLNPNDTFNLMTFAGGVGFCFNEPVPNTPQNRTTALEYLKNLQGSGGTEMMKAIHACLGGNQDPDRVRIVCFMTDGYVGNDMAIIDAVRANAHTTRVFSFGIGNSVNRYLLEGMARAGRGEVEFVLLNADADEAVKRLTKRIETPVLTDIELSFSEELDVSDLLPAPGAIPDLFDVKPLVIHGRYRTPAKGTVTIRGRTGAGAYERTFELDLPQHEDEHDVIATIWASNRSIASWAKDWMSSSSIRPMSPSTICLAVYWPQPMSYNLAISSIDVISRSM